jgi:hypothetical protein
MKRDPQISQIDPLAPAAFAAAGALRLPISQA